MEYLAKINSYVPNVVLGIGALLYLSFLIARRPHLLDVKQHIATTWGFTFWLLWWASIRWGYGLIPDYRPDVFPFPLLVLNLGDLCLVCFVIIYAGGNDNFRWIRLTPALVALTLLALYYFLYDVFIIPEHASAFWSILLISPSAVLANLAMFAFGWIMLVRWGYSAFLFFFITSLYSVLQVPAYMHAFLFKHHCIGAGADMEALRQRLDLAFYFLAGGKALLALFPLAYFFSTYPGNPYMRDSRYWPSRETSAQLHPKIKRGLQWLFAAVGAGVLTKLIVMFGARLVSGAKNLFS